MGRHRRLRLSLPPHRLVARPLARPLSARFTLGALQSDGADRTLADRDAMPSYITARTVRRFGSQCTPHLGAFRAGTLASQSPVERCSWSESPSTNVVFRDSRVAPLPRDPPCRWIASGAA
jgi:hypothetical protein